MQPRCPDLAQQHGDADAGAADVERHLDRVGPDHGAYAADIGVGNGHEREDGDDGDVAGGQANRVQQELYGDGGGEQADALGQQAGEQEGDGGDRLQAAPEALAQVLVGADELTLHIERQQHDGDDGASEQVADRELDEAERAEIGDAGHGNDGEGAGLGGDDGEADRPPGQVPLAHEIGRRTALPAGQAQADEGDRDHVNQDHRQVEQAHT